VQEQIEEMKKKEERMEKEMGEIQMQNKKLVEPLQKAKDDVEDLRKQLVNYEKDKASLAVGWRRLVSVVCIFVIWGTGRYIF